ncbi:MAG: hypothetical protein PGN21_00720 [Sphingomonas paucimobilis]
MRLYATIAATMLLAGCGFGPAKGGPELQVTGPSDAVAAFVRQQGAQIPSRATTFPQPAGDGKSSARVMLPAGAGAATMQSVVKQAATAGLAIAVVADR